MKRTIVKLLLIIGISSSMMAGNLTQSEKLSLTKDIITLGDVVDEKLNSSNIMKELESNDYVMKKYNSKKYTLSYKIVTNSNKDIFAIFKFLNLKDPNMSLVTKYHIKKNDVLLVSKAHKKKAKVVYIGSATGKDSTSTETNVKVNLDSDAYKSKNRLWVVGNAPKRFFDYSKNEFSELWGCQEKKSPNYGVDALGNCTWYAQGRLIELGYNKSLANKFSGHAESWSRTATDNGVKMDKTPTAGSIAQRGGAPFGHVAIVEKVNADGTIDISESSWAPCSNSWNFEWRIRNNISPTTFENYIHLTK